MTKTIYISGPITDNRTGLPREGWEKDFRDAEKTLRKMGVEVINPIRIAYAAESDWKETTEVVKRTFSDANLTRWPQDAPRWVYLKTCINRLSMELLSSVVDWPAKLTPLIAGLYVIGHPDDIQQSFGTMTEINFALSANLPVWSQYYHGYQIDNLLRQITTKPTLAEIQRTLNK